jgi:hypothetical protein
MVDINRTPINGTRQQYLAFLRLYLDDQFSAIKDAIIDEDADYITETFETAIRRLNSLSELPWEKGPDFKAIISEMKVLEQRTDIANGTNDEEDEDESEVATKLVEMAKRMLAANPGDEEALNTIREYDRSQRVTTTWKDLMVDFITFYSIRLEQLAYTE